MLQGVIKRRILPKLFGNKRLSRLEGTLGVRAVGYRSYIGGKWTEYGRLEFDFMLAQGLEPEHVLLDIACGSLRAGVHFIPYLEPGHYLGIEKEKDLIRQGLAKELASDVREQQRPELVVSSEFEFERFSKQADYSLAWSLFTHLIAPEVELCLRNLRANVGEGHQFYATFLPGSAEQNESRSHAHAAFYYPREDLEAMGERNGWNCEYLGEISSERDMKMRMMKFTPA